MLLEGPPWFLSAWGHSSKNVTNSGSPEHPPAHRVGAVTPPPPVCKAEGAYDQHCFLESVSEQDEAVIRQEKKMTRRGKDIQNLCEEQDRKPKRAANCVKEK